MNEEFIKSWTEVELIRNVFHELRRASAAAYGLGYGLSNGAYGFSSPEQKEALELLQSNIQQIHEVSQWMSIWVLSKKLS